MSLTIGPYQLPNRLVLAPMAGITDSVFRRLCYQNGAGYAVGEMLSAQTHLWDSKKSSTRFANLDDPEPRSVQLLGIDPQELAQAARLQVEQGAQIIDLNLGCPAKKVCNIAAGSALLEYPGRVEQIFKAVTYAVDVPVTVKIRTGTDPLNRNAVQIAQLAEQQGLAAITIHGRTRADKFLGQAEYDSIKRVKQAVSLPVIANGDICDVEQAQFVLEYTLADGIMIGRGALGNPWIFKQIEAYLSNKQRLSPPDAWQRYQVIYAHLEGLYQLYGERQGVRIARKHLGWYAQHIDQGDTLRRRFNSLQTASEQTALLQHFFET